MTSLGQIWDQILPQIQQLIVYKKYQDVFEQLESEIYLSDNSEESIVYQKLKTMSKPLCNKQIKEDHNLVIRTIELIIRHAKLELFHDTIWISDTDMSVATVFGTNDLFGKTLLAKHIQKTFEEYCNSGELQYFLNTVVSKTRNIGIWCAHPVYMSNTADCKPECSTEVYSILEPYTHKYMCLTAPVYVKDILRCSVQLGVNPSDFEIDCAKVTESSIAIEIFN